MQGNPTQKIHWQPVSALPLIASMIDGLVDELGQQYKKLQDCRSRPHVLDDYTVNRVIQVYGAQSGDLWLYEQQLMRWKTLDLTVSERQEVNRLAEQLPTIKNGIAAILTLAEELKRGTIDTVLAKSDLELGLEWLLRNKNP